MGVIEGVSVGVGVFAGLVDVVVGDTCADGSGVEVGSNSGVTVGVDGLPFSVGCGVGVIMTSGGSPMLAAHASTTTAIKAVMLVTTNQKSTRIQRFI
jgi:hypothetical protein